ncbi:MAG: CBS domain-containing protein [Planctomycetes bacterium]|nr:CBS domain-containing protein [Planctomycetota bacterium]
MGQLEVTGARDPERYRVFSAALLRDLDALERLLGRAELFDTGPLHIGAEQEMFLVDAEGRPKPVAPEVLAELSDPRLVPELARFNLEANLSPRVLGSTCLSEMEREGEELVALADRHARHHGARVLLIGILPTIERGDLDRRFLSPNPRYAELDEALMQLRGGSLRCHVKGIDEVDARFDSLMPEAANTSFQFHLQTRTAEFVPTYNSAQLAIAPVLAASTNSPLWLGKRLWHETRIAVFQHTADGISRGQVARGHMARVDFGTRWLEHSILELFREDVARFRVLLARAVEEDPFAALARGEAPALAALRLHNGTVWRWNRPCYGVVDGKAHLRVEMRALPSGPTVIDEIASSALFLGLVLALRPDERSFTRRLDFSAARENFVAAARHGLGAELQWIDGQRRNAADLLLQELLPLARAGLASAGIEAGDIERLLDIVAERARTRRTGSAWLLSAHAALAEERTSGEKMATLVQTSLARAATKEPVHTWAPLVAGEAAPWFHGYRTLGQFMTRDLFTVRSHDLVDLAAGMMQWRKIRHVPVEDDEGRLVGLVTERAFLRHAMEALRTQRTTAVQVAEIMTKELITASPETPTLEAIELMRRHRIGCLPVVENGVLVGIATEKDFLPVAAHALRERLEIAGA